MPIRQANKGRYPKDWKTVIVPAIRARSGDRCEGSPAFPECRAVNGAPHPLTRSIVVLTVAHLEHDDLETRDLDQLRHWCQRCHLHYDRNFHRANARKTRELKSGQGSLNV